MKHSEIVFIVDRSGSMYGIASDMEGAMKEIIQKQKDLDGDVLVTYARFDEEYEEVFSEKNINDVDGFNLEPRGGTALHDAIGKTINKVERRFNQKEAADQPSRILFIIITDGGENSSVEFSKSQVQEMIKKVERDYDWGVTYPAANQDAIAVGNGIGVTRGSSVNFNATQKGVRAMSKSVSTYAHDFLSTGKASYDSEDASE